MMMKIVAVRIGDRYGPEYEEYLESKLPEYEFIWVREPIRDDVKFESQSADYNYRPGLCVYMHGIYVYA